MKNLMGKFAMKSRKSDFTTTRSQRITKLLGGPKVSKKKLLPLTPKKKKKTHATLSSRKLAWGGEGGGGVKKVVGKKKKKKGRAFKTKKKIESSPFFFGKIFPFYLIFIYLLFS